MAGNSLGSRGKFLYTSDGGTTYTILTDSDLGEAGGLAEGNNGRRPPRRFKPRAALVEAETAEGQILRKYVPCTSGSPLLADEPATVEIDGLTFTVTGRRGEKASLG